MTDMISVRFDKDSSKISNLLSEIREHKTSIGKATEECDISIWEMLEILKGKNIDWTGYNEKDLKRDLSILTESRFI